MTEPEPEELDSDAEAAAEAAEQVAGRVLFAEPGSSWWPVAWGPIFAAIGAGLEAATGPVHVAAWAIIGLGLAVLALVWVQARRRVCSVRLTRAMLYQGRERLSVSRIVEVDEVGMPVGARVLGGGWTVPKRFAEVPLKLRDNSVVVAWAKDPDGLRDALRPLITP